MLRDDLRLGGSKLSAAGRAVEESTVIGIGVETVLNQEGILYIPGGDGGTDYSVVVQCAVSRIFSCPDAATRAGITGKFCTHQARDRGGQFLAEPDGIGSLQTANHRHPRGACRAGSITVQADEERCTFGDGQFAASVQRRVLCTAGSCQIHFRAVLLQFSFKTMRQIESHIPLIESGDYALVVVLRMARIEHNDQLTHL